MQDQRRVVANKKKEAFSVHCVCHPLWPVLMASEVEMRE